MKKIFSLDIFQQMPLIGILRKMPPRPMHRMVKIFQSSGLTTLEVTMNSPGAAAMIQKLSHDFPGLNIGAGTVCNLNQLREAQQAGASFIVTPILDEEVIATCQEEGLAVFPGAFSPTEIYRTWQAGASMVKLFPAGRLGPSYLQDVLGPLDQIKLIAVGGVGLNNMHDFLQAGAAGLGLGSSLFPKQMIEEESWNSLEQHFQAFVKKYRAFNA